MGQDGLLVPMRPEASEAQDSEDRLSIELVQFFTSGDRARQLVDLLTRTDKTEKEPLRASRRARELVVESLDLFEQVPASYRLLKLGWSNLIGAVNDAVKQAATVLTDESMQPSLLRARLVHVSLIRSVRVLEYRLR